MSAKIHAINTVADHSLLTPKLDYLRELSGGDTGFITEILEMFIKEAPQSVAQSVQHLQERNFEMVRITVHKLKSSVQVVGGYHLATLIQDIETAAKETPDEGILGKMLAALHSGIEFTVNHLCQELNSMNSMKNAA